MEAQACKDAAKHAVYKARDYEEVFNGLSKERGHEQCQGGATKGEHAVCHVYEAQSSP